MMPRSELRIKFTISSRSAEGGQFQLHVFHGFGIVEAAQINIAIYFLNFVDLLVAETATAQTYRVDTCVGEGLTGGGTSLRTNEPPATMARFFKNNNKLVFSLVL